MKKLLIIICIVLILLSSIVLAEDMDRSSMTFVNGFYDDFNNSAQNSNIWFNDLFTLIQTQSLHGDNSTSPAGTNQAMATNPARNNDPNDYDDAVWCVSMNTTDEAGLGGFQGIRIVGDGVTNYFGQETTDETNWAYGQGQTISSVPVVFDQYVTLCIYVENDGSGVHFYINNDNYTSANWTLVGTDATGDWSTQSGLDSDPSLTTVHFDNVFSIAGNVTDIPTLSPPAPPPDNLTIQAVNENGGTINIFNASVDGTYYDTSSGTITTDKYANTTYNILVYATNHTSNYTANYNASLDASFVASLDYLEHFSVIMTSTLTFNVTIDGTLYTTNIGSVTTTDFTNVSQNKDIQIHAQNYFNKTITHDISSNLTTTLFRYPQVDAYNIWDSTKLTSFHINISNVNYTSNASGTIHLPFNTTTTIMATGTSYIPTFYSLALAGDGFFNLTNMTQSILTLTSTEIYTGNLIYNWTLITEQGSYSDEDGTITLYPNIGTYLWNWTNNGTYFNFTNLGATIDEQQENLAVTNVYARNITFIDELSLLSITPICTQGGYTVSSYPYYFPLLTSTMNCSAFGYQEKDLSLEPTPDTTQYNLTAVELWLTFTNVTEGVIETIDCNHSLGDCTTFNNSEVYVQQGNLTIGRVVVKFNPDGSNWQQKFEYDNDANTHIREYIQIIIPDLVQKIKVTGSGSPLEDARVTAMITGTHPTTNLTDWLTVYSDFTDKDGIASISIDDQNNYQICVQADGYEPNCDMYEIPPSNPDVILIDLEPSEVQIGNNYIASSCPNIYYTDRQCTIEVSTYQSYYSICINYTSATLNTSVCGFNSASRSWTYSLTNSTGNVTINVYLDGVQTRTLTHNYMPYEPNIEIEWDTPTDNDGFTLLSLMQNSREYRLVVYFILIIIGVIMGFMAEKYFNGYGTYGTGIWFLFMALGGLYIFWVPVVVIAVYAIIEKAVPLFTNK